jgi:hypothetical protein
MYALPIYCTTITRSNTIGALYLALHLFVQQTTSTHQPRSSANHLPPCHINEALYHQSGTYHQLRSLSKDQALETCPYPHDHAYITVQMNENHMISHPTSQVLPHHHHHHHTNAVTCSPRKVIGSGEFPSTIQLELTTTASEPISLSSK